MSAVNSMKGSQSQAGNGIDLDNVLARTRQTVLVVDDEPDTITLLKHIFMMHNYNVSGASSGKEALRKISDVNPALVVLDLLMPEMDGLQTLEEIHKISNVPVIILSAVGQKEDIVKALRSGTDDYVTKPFNADELVARVEAVLRRSASPTAGNVYVFPEINLSVDLNSYVVNFKGKNIQLTGKMFELLAILVKNAPKVVKYREITEAIWGEDSTAVRNRLKYLIYLLRKEFLNIDSENEVIHNVDRLGYKLIIGRE